MAWRCALFAALIIAFRYILVLDARVTAVDSERTRAA